MQIICVSRGTFGGGKELAEKLATKLGYQCIAREQITDSATRAGIPVGKLEMAVVRPRPFSEQMAVDKERLGAFITATLAEKALESGVVYHGRTGHLVLPNVDNVLRVRAIMDAEARTARTMARLGLNREKARAYNDEVDEDRRRWVRTIYNVDWDDPSHYDIVVNFDHMSVENSASALVGVAGLPEFQETPASRRTLENLALAAHCRLAIGEDTRTRHIDVQVQAVQGAVTVTYHPRHERAAHFIPEVLISVKGVREVMCTTASTNILWIQERYKVGSPALEQITEIAEKWNAAVGLVRLLAHESEQDPSVGGGSAGDPEVDSSEAAEDETEREAAGEHHAGILDDTQEAEAETDDGGLAQTIDKLIQHGRAGGSSTVRGGPQALVKSLDRTATVSLVVVGDVFLSKSESIRKRETRELSAFLSESLRVPVIGTEDLKAQYLFGPSHWLKLLGYLAIVVLMFGAVFTHQEQVLWILTREGTQERIMAAVAIALIVPVFAYAGGNFAQYFLRLLKFE